VPQVLLIFNGFFKTLTVAIADHSPHRKTFAHTTMQADVETGPIQGQLLRLSERRQVAIYLRQGKLWIADFIDDHGELVEPETWFRFNCGWQAPDGLHRMLLESALPLFSEIVAKIERMHQEDRP
jgi:hypothetical protein